MRKPVTMERRHFEFIAETIRTIEDDEIRRHVARRFCAKLASTNANFDRERFMIACGAE